jgi:hypothetical protein
LIVKVIVKPNFYGFLIARWLKTPSAINITGLGNLFSEKTTKYKLLQFLIYTILRFAANVPNFIFDFENKDNQQLFIE